MLCVLGLLLALHAAAPAVRSTVMRNNSIMIVLLAAKVNCNIPETSFRSTASLPCTEQCVLPCRSWLYAGPVAC